jgi:hypothetical protein
MAFYYNLRNGFSVSDIKWLGFEPLIPILNEVVLEMNNLNVIYTDSFSNYDQLIEESRNFETLLLNFYSEFKSSKIDKFYPAENPEYTIKTLTPDYISVFEHI